MGQQQLLLLVLGTVIVGLGVVAGIDAFNSNQESSNQDALVNQAVRVASDAQAWMQKPEAYGGGGGQGDNWDQLSLSDLGYETTANDSFETQYGNIGIGSTGGGDSLEVTAYSSDYDQTITVAVGGTGSDDISTTVE